MRQASTKPANPPSAPVEEWLWRPGAATSRSDLCRWCIGVSLVHAGQEVAERMIGVPGVVLVHTVDCDGDAGDGHSLFPGCPIWSIMSMLIHNFGLFWRRNDVFWGRPKVRGHLKGVPAKEPSALPADFRDQAGVYVLYDDNFRLVYIGQAGAGNQYLFSRLKHHKKDALADR
jgi:hypothetical protein